MVIRTGTGTASGANADGSDANSSTVELPRHFRHPLDAPFADVGSITFLYNAADAMLTIDGNLSNEAQFTGECR